MKVKSESEVAQSCPTLSAPMDCSPPGSSVHGIFQARVLEWGSIPLHYFPLKQWNQPATQQFKLKTSVILNNSLSHLLYLVFSSYNHIHTHFPTHVSRTDRADREREEEKGKALCNKVFTVGGKMSKIEQTRAPIYYVQIILYLVWQWPIVESRTSHPVCSLLLLLSRFSRI